MRQLAPDLHVFDAPQRFMGIELGTRMTVMSLEGGLLLHSPVLTDRDAFEASLGAPRWVLAPNLFHHLYVQPWIEAGAQAYAAPGLDIKRADLAFEGVIDTISSPFGDEVLIVPMRSIDVTNELVVLHRPSRTLVVTDLVFHIQETAPWTTRVGMRAIGGYPGVRATLLERVAMKREQAREDIAGLLDLDFDRLIMAHGAIVEQGGRDALAEAFSWLRI